MPSNTCASSWRAFSLESLPCKPLRVSVWSHDRLISLVALVKADSREAVAYVPDRPS